MSTRVLCAITVALRESMVTEVLEAGGREALRSEIKDLAEQAFSGELRRYVGGATPQSTPLVNLDGPHADPIQGPIYGLSIGAYFHLEDLPQDSAARLAYERPDVDGPTTFVDPSLV